MLSIRTNIPSLQAQRSLNVATASFENSLAKLSSGLRITRASDDAAGLGVATNLNAQIRSFLQAGRNAADGLSVAQTAEAALNESSNILTRLRELALQSSSDGLTNEDRAFLQVEANELIAELDRIDATTEFNGAAIFGAASPQTFQVGIRGSPNDFITLDTTAMNVDALQLGNGSNNITEIAVGGPLNLETSAAQSASALAVIDAAINDVSTFRATLGAVANRLASASSTIATATEEATSALSRVRDVDFAEETATAARASILQQAAISVLAQANQQQQLVLKLLDF